MKKTESSNGLVLCIIIIVIVGLFLHYELGFGSRLDLFSISGRNKRHKRNPHHHDKHNYDNRFKESPIHHRWLHNFYSDHTHPRNISIGSAEYANTLLSNYDHTVHTKSGEERELDKQELINAIKGDIKKKFESGDHYNFY